MTKITRGAVFKGPKAAFFSCVAYAESYDERATAKFDRVFARSSKYLCRAIGVSADPNPRFFLILISERSPQAFCVSPVAQRGRLSLLMENARFRPICPKK